MNWEAAAERLGHHGTYKLAEWKRLPAAKDIVAAAVDGNVLYERGINESINPSNDPTLQQIVEDVEDHIAWLLEVGGLVQVEMAHE